MDSVINKQVHLYHHNSEGKSLYELFFFLLLELANSKQRAHKFRLVHGKCMKSLEPSGLEENDKLFEVFVVVLH